MAQVSDCRFDSVQDIYDVIVIFVKLDLHLSVNADYSVASMIR